MTDQTRLTSRPILVGALIVLPLLVFIVLRLNPSLDPVWQAPFFHFYIVSYISLIAVVISSFILRGVRLVQGGRLLFVGAAYVSLGAIFFIHGISTPVVLSPHISHAVGWSARLSLTVCAAFMNLALMKPANPVMRWAVANTRRFWLALILGYAVLGFFTMSTAAADPMTALMTLMWLSTALAGITIAMYLWASWRAWRAYQREREQLLLILSFTLPWLALAQLSQWLAPPWNLSWWMYHVLMLGAFVITMATLAREYEHVRRFRLVRYFTAMTIILGVPLVALLSEVAADLSGVDGIRWPMFGIIGSMLFLVFIALYLIVRRGQRILDARTAALEAERQWRGDLTNLIVHDLKTPLATIHMGSAILLAGQGGTITEMGQRHLERIQRASDEMTRLVNNMLDVERLEAGALSLLPVQTDMKIMLIESIDGVHDLAEAYRVELQTAITDGLPDVEVDHGLMKRVIQNLLSNAIKFAAHPGQVKVEAALIGDKLVVGIIDDGPGVPVAQRQRIFEKFAQIDDVERRGTGLGLTFAKLAIEAHGGMLWVEDGPDGGSRFAFSLPTPIG